MAAWSTFCVVLTGLPLLLLEIFFLSNAQGDGFESALYCRIIVLVCAFVSVYFIWWMRRDRTAEDVERIFEKYQISERGFLPHECAKRLPKQWEAWEALIDQLPQLNRSRQVKRAVEELPVLSAIDLDTLPELRRASWVLGAMACSYLNGDSVPWEKIESEEAEVVGEGAPQNGNRVLPATVAVPWLHVCTKLGLPPVLCASTVDLWNWKLKTESAAASFEPSDLTCVSTMTDTQAEVMFHMLPCSMQNIAGPLITRVFKADLLLHRGCDGELTRLLTELAHVFVRFRELFSHVYSLVDRRIFYDVYRPLLSGYFPDGVQLAGLDAEIVRQDCAEQIELGLISVDSNDGKVRSLGKGPSAGQSTMIVLFDLFLGVTECHTNGVSLFQHEMLGYMPAAHRMMVQDFAEKIKKVGSVRTYIEGRSGRSRALDEVKQAHAAALTALKQFRSFHLGAATSYLVKTDKGTGETDFRSMLRECIEGTKRAAEFDVVGQAEDVKRK
eukprot:TRINITY_DN36911_c0_g1_i1.p1 TRINITY_DN36911_c0_g1~~TRINITY_DN36911_c0_g1_i1.p1  ORF type:complete len:499 (+),score=71.37 TRINITY_DN36911_c0_g1_i1:62-1558(+)